MHNAALLLFFLCCLQKCFCSVPGNKCNKAPQILTVSGLNRKRENGNAQDLSCTEPKIIFLGEGKENSQVFLCHCCFLLIFQTHLAPQHLCLGGGTIHLRSPGCPEQPQAELLLFPNSCISMAKNEAEKRILHMCLAKHSQMQAQMAAPTLQYLLPVLFMVLGAFFGIRCRVCVCCLCREAGAPISVHGREMEEQSFVLIANLNKLLL